MTLLQRGQFENRMGRVFQKRFSRFFKSQFQAQIKEQRFISRIPSKTEISEELDFRSYV